MQGAALRHRVSGMFTHKIAIFERRYIFQNHHVWVSMLNFRCKWFFVSLNVFDVSWWRRLQDYNATGDPTRVTRRSFGVRLLFHQQGVIGKGDGWIPGTALKYLYVPFWERTYPPHKGSLEDDFPFPKVKYFGSHGVDINMIYNDCFF